MSTYYYCAYRIVCPKHGVPFKIYTRSFGCPLIIWLFCFQMANWKWSFHGIANIYDRLWFQSQIIITAVDNGLQTKDVFIIHKHGVFTGLKSLIMSTLYILLVCSRPCFDEMATIGESVRTTFHLVGLLQSNIALLFFFTDNNIDSAEDSARSKWNSYIA